MATSLTTWVLPNGALWIDADNLPAAVDVLMDDGSVVQRVPINWAEFSTPSLPGLNVENLPELLKQAVRTLRSENAGRTAGPGEPVDIVGVKITLRQG